MNTAVSLCSQTLVHKSLHARIYLSLLFDTRAIQKSHRNNQQDATEQYNLLFHCFLIAQHVSDNTPLIIRSSKSVIAAFGFTYVFGCRLPLRWLSGNRQPKTYVKPETAITVFELLMMGGLSPETCWAIKKHWNNKFYYYTVASCWFFLRDLYLSLSVFILCGFIDAVHKCRDIILSDSCSHSLLLGLFIA